MIRLLNVICAYMSLIMLYKHMKVDYNIGLTIFWAILLFLNTIGILNGFKGVDKNE